MRLSKNNCPRFLAGCQPIGSFEQLIIFRYLLQDQSTQNTQNSQSMLEYLDHAEILHNFNFLVLATAPINAPSACQMRWWFFGNPILWYRTKDQSSRICTGPYNGKKNWKLGSVVTEAGLTNPPMSLILYVNTCGTSVVCLKIFIRTRSLETRAREPWVTSFFSHWVHIQEYIPTGIYVRYRTQ